jgi:hypothetical protein
MEKPRYIDLDYEEALQLKFESGKRKHRKSGTAFSGDPTEELFEELLDAYHYIVEIESSGASLPGYRTTVRNMALNLQSRRRELKRRI